MPSLQEWNEGGIKKKQIRKENKFCAENFVKSYIDVVLGRHFRCLFDFTLPAQKMKQICLK